MHTQHTSSQTRISTRLTIFIQSPSHIQEKCDATIYKDIPGPRIEDLSKKIGPPQKMRSEVG
jgi:hypothetical protein